MITTLGSDASLKKHAFLGEYLKYWGNLKVICEKIDIVPATYYKWLREDEEFVLALKSLKISLSAGLLQEGYRRAIQSSDVLLKFLLEQLDPEQFNTTLIKQQMQKEMLDEYAFKVPSKEELKEILLNDPFVDYVRVEDKVDGDLEVREKDGVVEESEAIKNIQHDVPGEESDGGDTGKGDI